VRFLSGDVEKIDKQGVQIRETHKGLEYHWDILFTDTLLEHRPKGATNE